MENNKLQQAQNNAYSLVSIKDTRNMTLIGEVKEDLDTFIYYEDEDGNFYFLSERIIKFDAEMEAAQKRLNKKNRIRRWHPERFA